MVNSSPVVADLVGRFLSNHDHVQGTRLYGDGTFQYDLRFFNKKTNWERTVEFDLLEVFNKSFRAPKKLYDENEVSSITRAEQVVTNDNYNQKLSFLDNFSAARETAVLYGYNDFSMINR